MRLFSFAYSREFFSYLAIKLRKQADGNVNGSAIREQRVSYESAIISENRRGRRLIIEAFLFEGSSSSYLHKTPLTRIAKRSSETEKIFGTKRFPRNSILSVSQASFSLIRLAQRQDAIATFPLKKPAKIKRESWKPSSKVQNISRDLLTKALSVQASASFTLFEFNEIRKTLGEEYSRN